MIACLPPDLLKVPSAHESNEIFFFSFSSCSFLFFLSVLSFSFSFVPQNRASKEVLLAPIVISRNEKEKVLIESSINSIRFSIKIKQADDIEEILCHKFTRFMMQRAENFVILRRKPVAVSPSTFLLKSSFFDPFC